MLRLKVKPSKLRLELGGVPLRWDKGLCRCVHPVVLSAILRRANIFVVSASTEPPNNLCVTELGFF